MTWLERRPFDGGGRSAVNKGMIESYVKYSGLQSNNQSLLRLHIFKSANVI
jgi:hypothetical protein